MLKREQSVFKILKSAFFGTFLVISYLTLSNCKSSQVQSDESHQDQAKVKEDTYIASANLKQVIIDPLFDERSTGDAFTIDTAYIDKNVLTVDVYYSGGSAKHEFKMYSKNNFLKTKPPKLNLYLSHDGGNDQGQKNERRSLTFDVTNIQYLGQKSIKFWINDSEIEMIYNY